MNLIVDNSNLFAGGSLQVAASFLQDLKTLGLPDEYHIIQSLQAARAISKDDFPANFHFYELTEATVKSKLQRIREVKAIEKRVQPEAIFTVFGPSYHKSTAPKLVGFAIPHLIYGDSPFFKSLTLKERIYNKALTTLKRYCFKHYSDGLVFETENARSIFTRKCDYKKPSFTASNTLNAIFAHPEKWQPLQLNNSRSCNIVYLSAHYPHKNMNIIPAVIDSLRKDHQLEDFCFLLSQPKSVLNFPDAYDPYIDYLGPVPLECIPSLYQQSQIVFMPTLLEVFSTTYLEAMHMKKPLVASDMPFARDICGTAASYSPPLSATGYAKAISEIHSDSMLRDRLIANGEANLSRFGTSMDRTLAYLECIRKVVAEASH